MGNSAGQVCCCERKVPPPRKSKGLAKMPAPLYAGASGSPLPSPRALGSQQQQQGGDSGLDAFLSSASSSSQRYQKEIEPTPPSDDRRSCKSWKGDAEAKVKVDAVEAQAVKLKGVCKKYPTSGSEGWGYSLKAKERFFALAPDSSLCNKGASWYDRLRAWQAGSLSYWESENAFRQGYAPKGSIPLLSITKVSIDEGSPYDVFVKYDRGGGQADESDIIKLRLNFTKRDKAEKFRYGLRTVRATL
eukprot:TRINITY_DN67420_c0_g1_i1.p1 TRINITY_DN67420_c0_g1~~TRINITY_DN67420_c0_g1_i1.p1  ORF type:complete len:259 (-),score=47.24 TRINITY_DN67420_c0_g1_i1:77-814(-)